MSININLKQAKTLLRLFGGQDAEMTVQYGKAGHSGPGLYSWCSGYGEDGSDYLGPGDDDELTKARP